MKPRDDVDARVRALVVAEETAHGHGRGRQHKREFRVERDVDGRVHDEARVAALQHGVEFEDVAVDVGDHERGAPVGAPRAQARLPKLQIFQVRLGDGDGRERIDHLRAAADAAARIRRRAAKDEKREGCGDHAQSSGETGGAGMRVHGTSMLPVIRQAATVTDMSWKMIVRLR